jgi:hypothetical protein
MRIEQKHSLGEAEAMRRIDTVLDDLLGREPPGGITVSNAWKNWNGNRMDFSLSAGKGMFRTTVSGTMLVTKGAVVVESELPGLVRSFVGEDRVAGVLQRELARVLAEDGRR